MLYSHVCSFILTVYQKDKEQFFISSEPFIFLSREGLIQLPAWCPLRCLLVSKTGSRREVRTRTCVLEEQLQAERDAHQVTLTNELTSWIEPATSTLKKLNLFLFWVWLCLKITPQLISAILCLKGLGWFVIFPNTAFSQCDICPWVLWIQRQLPASGCALTTRALLCLA